MQSKLTLRLDEELIKSAKEYAKGQQKSLSQVVAEFFIGITSAKSKSADKKVMPLGPVTSKLAGSLKGAKFNEDDYKNHLSRKYF